MTEHRKFVDQSCTLRLKEDEIQTEQNSQRKNNTRREWICPSTHVTPLQHTQLNKHGRLDWDINMCWNSHLKQILLRPTTTQNYMLSLKTSKGNMLSIRIQKKNTTQRATARGSLTIVPNTTHHLMKWKNRTQTSCMLPPFIRLDNTRGAHPLLDSTSHVTDYIVANNMVSSVVSTSPIKQPICHRRSTSPHRFNCSQELRHHANKLRKLLASSSDVVPHHRMVQQSRVTIMKIILLCIHILKLVWLYWQVSRTLVLHIYDNWGHFGYIFHEFY